MGLFAVRYEYKPGTDALRDEHRPVHVDFLRGLHEQGVLITSGPTDPETENAGALLIIQAESLEAADATMAEDPFAKHDALVRRVFEWRPFFGKELWESAQA